MTGLPVAIVRQGQRLWCDIDTLSDRELQRLAATGDPERGWAIAITLAAWVRDNVRLVPWEELGDLADLAP